MKFKVINEYKSWTKSAYIAELPDLVILAGENGTGKTQFLDAIKNQSIILTSDSNNITVTENMNRSLIIKEDSITLRNKGYFMDDINHTISIVFRSYENNTSSVVQVNGVNMGTEDIIRRIKADFNSKDINLSVIRRWFQKYGCESNPFETNNLIKIFSEYYRDYANNLVMKSENRNFMTDEEFKEVYGEKPWEIFNKLLYDDAKLNFKFLPPNGISSNDYNDSVCCDNKYGKEFSIADLSSGEKVLLTIAMTIYSGEKIK